MLIVKVPGRMRSKTRTAIYEVIILSIVYIVNKLGSAKKFFRKGENELSRHHALLDCWYAFFLSRGSRLTINVPFPYSWLDKAVFFLPIGTGFATDVDVEGLPRSVNSPSNFNNDEKGGLNCGMKRGRISQVSSVWYHSRQ